MKTEIKKISYKIATIYVSDELYDLVGYDNDMQSFYDEEKHHFLTKVNLYEIEEVQEKFVSGVYPKELKYEFSLVYDKVMNLIYDKKVSEVYFGIEEK